MPKISANIGAFVIPINPDGKVLLGRRKQTNSIYPGVSFKGCWEMIGGAVEDGNEGSDYKGVFRAALQKFKEKSGVDLASLGWGSQSRFTTLPPLLVKGTEGYDLAIGFALDIYGAPVNEFNGPDFIWANADELNQLARDYTPAFKGDETNPPRDGTGLLSGWGKRQHVMLLSALGRTLREQASTPLQ